MRKTATLVFFVVLSAVVAFGSRTDQGSTSDGVGLSLCASSVSPCDQFATQSYGGQILSGPAHDTNPAHASVVENLFIFSNSVGTTGVTLNPGALDADPDAGNFTYGLLNCSGGPGSASAPSLGAPCMNAAGDAFVNAALQSDGTVLFTWDPTKLMPYTATGLYSGDVVFYILGKDDSGHTISVTDTFFGGAPYASPTSPTPEPSSIFLLLTGAVGCATRIRRKIS